MESMLAWGGERREEDWKAEQMCEARGKLENGRETESRRKETSSACLESLSNAKTNRPSSEIDSHSRYVLIIHLTFDIHVQ
jgi:hypothetical protein